MRFIIILLLLNTTLLSMGQTSKNDILFEKKNLNIELSKDKNSDIFLTEVVVYKSTNLNIFWGSEMDEKEFEDKKIKFTLFFKTLKKQPLSQKEIETIAYLSPDTVGYKIYEASFISAWFKRNSVDSIWSGMSFEAAKGVIRCTGNSENDDLLVSEVWKYVNNIKKIETN